MEFIKKFETRAPKYLTAYRDIINRFALVGGRDEDLKEQTGRVFSNVYEFYMYAAMLGLKKNYRVPLEGMEALDFRKLQFWQPSNIVHFIVMALLTKSGIELISLEDMNEGEIEGVIGNLRKLLEEYANGGLDIIASKMKEKPYFFEDDYCFLNLLD